MRRESRMILTVGGLGVGAVLVMGMMAQRYSTVVEERAETAQKREAHVGFRTGASGFRTGGGAAGGETPTASITPEKVARSQESADDRALRYVDAFLGIRRAMRDALDERGTASPARQTEIARATRDAELSRSWMEDHEYRQLLMIYRAWKDGRKAPTREFGEAFERRRELASSADLGALESLDL